MADDLRLGERFDIIVGVRRCVSDLQEITPEGTMVLSAPTFRGTPVLLDIGSTLVLVYYRVTGMFSCSVKVVDKRRNDGFSLIEVEISSPIKKYQRRDFVRFETTLSVAMTEVASAEKAKNMTPADIMKISYDRRLSFIPQDLDVRPASGITLDISGGGARISSTKTFEVGAILECTFELDEKTRITLMSRVLRGEETHADRYTFQMGVTFVGIDEKTRKTIIRYIFEEQSKRR